jgi:hypothetical protein
MERARGTHSFPGTYIECSIALLGLPAAAALSAAQIPGGRKHGLTGAGGGLQHGLDAGDHRDGGRGERVLSLAKSIANMRFRQDISRMTRIVFDLLA